MSTIQTNRILAVDIRAARLGFAVFEKPKDLRDFGAAWFGSHVEARSRIARLLRLFRPNLLVLRGASGRSAGISGRRRRKVVRTAGRVARKSAIPVTRITEYVFKSYFEQHACHNKYEVAVLVASWFPEVAWKLPRRRKFYEAEARAMIYFDAVALGIVYLAQQSQDSEELFRRTSR